MYVVWQRGKMILFFTFVAMILAYLATLTTPNRYQAAATLFMNKSKIGARTMENPSIPMKTYHALFFGKKILKEIIDNNEFLKKRPYQIKRPADLSDRVLVYEVPDTPLLKILVDLEDPIVAANIANELAAKAIKINEKLIRFEKETNKKKLADELEFIQSKTDDYQDKYAHVLTKNLKPSLIAKLGNKTSILLTLEQQKETLDHSIIELEERESRFKDILSGTDFNPIMTIQRKVAASPIMEAVVNSQLKGELDFSQLKDLSFSEETINPDYSMLYAEYKKLQVDLPSMIKKRDNYKARIKVIADEADTMQERLSEIELEEMIAKANFDRSLEILSGIDKQEGWAGMTVTSERQDLFLIDEAFPDDKKVYPRRSLTAGLAGMIAFLLSFLYYLLADLYGLMTSFQKKRSDTVEEEST